MKTDTPRASTLGPYQGETVENCQPPKNPTTIQIDELRSKADILENMISAVYEAFDCLLTPEQTEVLKSPNMDTCGIDSPHSLLVEWLMTVSYSLDCSIMRLNRLLERSDVG